MDCGGAPPLSVGKRYDFPAALLQFALLLQISGRILIVIIFFAMFFGIGSYL
jgi:hypothetical protein